MPVRNGRTCRDAPTARNPLGADGYVFSVATDPDARRRGYARACVDALLECSASGAPGGSG